MKITNISGREVFDSRGWPTVQCEIALENEQSVIATVPAGLSVGSKEAKELRDGGQRLFGKGVLKAIENIDNIIAPAFIGKEPNAIDMDLKMIEMDGTVDKSVLGANAMLAVSMALYRAEALVQEVELFELIAYLMGYESVSLPFPQLNIINGGAHANDNLRVQEFLIVPVGAPHFRAALETGVEVFHQLKQLLEKNGKSVNVGDEGGFAPEFENEEEAFDFILEAIEQAHKKHPYTSIIGIDVAASQFYDSATNLYKWHEKLYSADDMIGLYQDYLKKYPLYSIEDGLDERDWDNWVRMTKALENKVQIVGDDLFATNIHNILKGIELHAATGVIIKPNQVGTITESLQAIKLCKSQDINTIVSHRSGETEDTFIADLAVGANAGQIKAGSCSRSERVAKYNRLLRIEDMLHMSLFEA